MSPGAHPDSCIDHLKPSPIRRWIITVVLTRPAPQCGPSVALHFHRHNDPTAVPGNRRSSRPERSFLAVDLIVFVVVSADRDVPIRSALGWTCSVVF